MTMTKWNGFMLHFVPLPTEYHTIQVTACKLLFIKPMTYSMQTAVYKIHDLYSMYARLLE